MLRAVLCTDPPVEVAGVWWTTVAAQLDDGVMVTRRWVIIGVGVVAAAGLVTAAAVFGLQGVEAASWIAGVAGVVVGVAAIALSRPTVSSVRPSSAAAAVAGSRSVQTSGEISGVVSTGDGSVIIQHQ
jgi:hypothetical protein